jgi:tight adherence protein C
MDTLSLPLSDSTNVGLAAAMAFTFGSVFFLVLGVNVYIRSRGALKKRAVKDWTPVTREMAFDQGELINESSPRDQSIMATSALLADVERGAAANEDEASKVRRELLRAGFFSPRSVFWYQMIRACLLVMAGLGGYLLYRYFFPSAAGSSSLLVAACLACAAFLLPNRYVVMRQNRVVRECLEGFPELIDLMVICAEAGLGPRAAIDQLSREIAKAYPILGAHCFLASLEIRAGSSLHEALFNLSRRIQVEETAILASLLEQTELLGTSVTDALRVYSEDMRGRRLIRAEEKAQALSAKLVLPLVLFVFPVILVVVLLPAVVKIKNTFSVYGGFHETIK